MNTLHQNTENAEPIDQHRPNYLKCNWGVCGCSLRSRSIAHIAAPMSARCAVRLKW